MAEKGHKLLEGNFKKYLSKSFIGSQNFSIVQFSSRFSKEVFKRKNLDREVNNLLLLYTLRFINIANFIFELFVATIMSKQLRYVMHLVSSLYNKLL